MKKKTLLKLVVGTAAAITLGVLTTTKAEAAEGVDMYRVYNQTTGEHFYTADDTEARGLLRAGWKYEGIGWVAPTEGDNVYRLYNKNSGDHHYTTSAKERDHLKKVGWNYEGVGWKSSKNKEVPLYRAYNPRAKAGSHNYTTSTAEQNNLKKIGWRDEGTAWYGVGAGNADSSNWPVNIEKTKQMVLTEINNIRKQKNLKPLTLKTGFEKDMEKLRENCYMNMLDVWAGTSEAFNAENWVQVERGLTRNALVPTGDKASLQEIIREATKYHTLGGMKTGMYDFPYVESVAISLKPDGDTIYYVMCFAGKPFEEADESDFETVYVAPEAETEWIYTDEGLVEVPINR